MKIVASLSASCAGTFAACEGSLSVENACRSVYYTADHPCSEPCLATQTAPSMDVRTTCWHHDAVETHGSAWQGCSGQCIQPAGKIQCQACAKLTQPKRAPCCGPHRQQMQRLAHGSDKQPGLQCRSSELTKPCDSANGSKSGADGVHDCHSYPAPISMLPSM